MIPKSEAEGCGPVRLGMLIAEDASATVHNSSDLKQTFEDAFEELEEQVHDGSLQWRRNGLIASKGT